MNNAPGGARTYEFGLADRLRIAREKAGLGQREFAALSGISRGSVANYENGKTGPRRPALMAWAEVTGFSLEWLETGEEGGGTGHSDATNPRRAAETNEPHTTYTRIEGRGALRPCPQ